MAGPLISFAGIATGIDTKSLIAALVGVRKKPINLLDARRTEFEQLRTRYKTLQSKLDTLQDAAKELQKSKDFLAFKAASSNESIATATATGAAAPGSYSLDVAQLATGETEVSTGFDDYDTTAVSSSTEETLQITIDGTTTNVTIDADSTLEEIKDAINDADLGVSATVINDGSPSSNYKLVVSSDTTGEDQAISFSDDQGGAGIAQALNFTEEQSAQNAVLEVNGIDIERSTNVIGDVVEGVTFTLQSAGSSTVTVNPDFAAIKGDVQKFISAHNDVISFINSEIAVSEITEQGGAFNGESTVRSLKNTLLSQFASAGYPGGSSYSTLSQVGIQLNADGTLKFDAAKFEDAASGALDDLTTLFTQKGDFFSQSGFQIVDVPDSIASGTYSIGITQAASKASVTGTGVVTGTGLAQDETLTIDTGAKTIQVDLLAGDDIDAIVGKVNAALDDEDVEITASDDGGALSLTADEYGSAHGFTVSSSVGAITDAVGFSQGGDAATGQDVAGTLDGVAFTGEGQKITAASGSSLAGVEVLYVGGETPTAELTVGPDGFFLKFDEILEGFLNPVGGVIDNRIDSLTTTIDDIDDRILSLEQRVDQYEQLLIKQFAALEGVIGKLQSQQSALSTFSFELPSS